MLGSDTLDCLPCPAKSAAAPRYFHLHVLDSFCGRRGWKWLRLQSNGPACRDCWRAYPAARAVAAVVLDICRIKFERFLALNLQNLLFLGLKRRPEELPPSYRDCVSVVRRPDRTTIICPRPHVGSSPSHRACRLLKDAIVKTLGCSGLRDNFLHIEQAIIVLGRCQITLSVCAADVTAAWPNSH